jgi:hypothetical protein
MITQQNPEEQELTFYAKKFYFSYSSLNKLLFSPRTFYTHYVLKQREDRMDSYLVEGKVIHCLLLEGDKFNDYFIVSPSKLPEGNGRLIVDKVYSKYADDPDIKEFKDYEKDIVDILSEINLHQALKTDAQRIERVVIDQNISYFNFLKNKGNKTIVDAETLEYCSKSVEVFKSNSQIVELLGMGKVQTDTFKVYNEMPLEMDLPGFPFGLKGIVDNIVVDADNKRIYINDIKTTGKGIQNFQESVDFFNYWMQSAVYIRLVLEYFQKYIDGSWLVKFNFIVIDKNQQVYPFEVSPASTLEWLKDLNTKLLEATYHYNNKDYTLPYKFVTGQVYL